MAKRGVKSTVMTNVPPEVREKVDADIITVLTHPGTGDDARPRDYNDVYRWNDLEKFGVSIHALNRYAIGVEARHKLSLSATVAEAVASQRTDLVPAARNLFAAKVLERVMEEGKLDNETLASLANVVDRFQRTELAEAEARRRSDEALIKGLSSNAAIGAFIAACEGVLGDAWTEKREDVLRVMQEKLKT